MRITEGHEGTLGCRSQDQLASAVKRPHVFDAYTARYCFTRRQGRGYVASKCNEVSSCSVVLAWMPRNSTPTTCPRSLKSRMIPGRTSSESTIVLSSSLKYRASLALSTFSRMCDPLASDRRRH